MIKLSSGRRKISWIAGSCQSRESHHAMNARGKRRPKKTAKAIGRFITREVHQLKRLARDLNTVWVGEHAGLGEQVAAIIEAARPVSYPGISNQAGELLQAL